MTSQGQPRILVGVSGSHASELALRWAAAEAARLHGQLRVIRVWTAELHAPYAPQAEPAGAAQDRSRADRDLDAAVAEVLGPALPDYVITEVIEGMAERTLVELSAGADLLVLGESSTHGLAGRSLGPVIRTCLSRAHCPVVVVGPEGLPGGEPTFGDLARPPRQAAAASHRAGPGQPVGAAR
jgi:nucleotide-binding universal stress UspA family protein